MLPTYYLRIIHNLRKLSTLSRLLENFIQVMQTPYGGYSHFKDPLKDFPPYPDYLNILSTLSTLYRSTKNIIHDIEIIYERYLIYPDSIRKLFTLSRYPKRVRHIIHYYVNAIRISRKCNPRYPDSIRR